MQAAFETHDCQEFLQIPHPLDCHVITRLVMAVANVSPTHQDTVSTTLKGPEDMMRGYGGRAHHTHNTDIGRVLQPAHTGQVRRAIGAPVAHKGYDFGFKKILFHFVLLVRYF
jgi:hypothetical protein